MNKAQQQVQQQFLHNEKDALNALKQNYQDALDEINDRIAILLGRSDADMQHVIYQVEYQQALKDQISAILDQMQSNNYTTLSDYLEKSYEDGFIGTMYDLQSQGIPLIFPIDQRQVVEAIQHDTKLSEPLYKRLGKDTKLLKRQISQEISRGISNGEMVNKIAKNIAGYAGISQNNAMRIARTESHRIQIKSAQDAQWKAKEKGADIVKQWDSTLDGNTRDTHRKLDGQIRELDEDFEVDGMTASAPGMFGDPAEDCNCRCALLQRARWALDNDYTKWSEDAPVLISDDGTTQFVNVKANDYDSFKKQYEDITERVQSDVQKISEKRKTSEGIFQTFNNSKGDSIRPHSIMKDMKTSEIGTNALNYLQNENVSVELCYGIDNQENLSGVYDPFDDVVIVYCDKTKTIKETASTVIHEATHRMNGNRGTLEEEIKCFEAEVLHRKGELTENDKKAIIEFVKENYPDLK